MPRAGAGGTRGPGRPRGRVARQRYVRQRDQGADADPADLLRALAGFTHFNAGPDWEASARRLIDILMDGLRRHP